MRLILSLMVLVTLLLLVGIGFALGLDAGAFELEREARLAAPPAVVFEQLDDLHHWPDWFPWFDREALAKGEGYSGAARGVGASYAWPSSSKLANNQLTIVESRTNERVVARFALEQGRTRSFQLRFDLTPEGSGARVHAVMTGTETWASKLFERPKQLIGSQLEGALKKLAEATQPSAR